MSKVKIIKVTKDDPKVIECEMSHDGKVTVAAVWKENNPWWEELKEGVEIDGEIKESPKKPGSFWFWKEKEQKKGFGGGGFKPNPRKDALMASIELHKGSIADPDKVLAVADKFLTWLTK